MQNGVKTDAARNEMYDFAREHGSVTDEYEEQCLCKVYSAEYTVFRNAFLIPTAIASDVVAIGSQVIYLIYR
jgi:hypothetical protein